MESVTRPSLAAAALVAGGVLAVAPVAPTVQLPDITLTAGLADMLDLQLNANAALVDTVLRANAGITHGQETFLGNQEAGAALQHLQESYNAMMGASQGALLGALGVRVIDPQTGAVFDPAALNASLQFTADTGVGADFGGVEGAAAHAVLAAAGSAGSPAGFQQLLSDLQAFNTALIAAEKSFNGDLLASEVAMEKAAFGTDSALNGVVNRGFNGFNMLFDTQQQGLNGFLGITGYNPQELTGSLLTGSGDQTFNDGSVGGLQGMFDQNLAMLADLGGLKAADLTGLFDNFDADAFTAASKGFFDTLLAGPFGDALTGDELTAVFNTISDLLTAAP